MRFGFTTGSCSAAAAKAATYMLLTGKKIEKISISTPKGIVFNADILDINVSEMSVSCCVVKDGGDDPDITTGAHVYASVSYVLSRDVCKLESEESRNECVSPSHAKRQNNIEEAKSFVLIDGGVGVGRVTKPGLDQPVGNAAINSVPREMIEKEVREIMELCDYSGGLQVIISIPEGEALAEKTFNPRLGIVGGISVIGTSGIVEPMSAEALRATIEVELRQKKALGVDFVPVSPGNYGLDYMKRTYDFDLDVSVKCSNFVGDTIRMADALDFKGMLFTGHIGKLAKVAGGMLNTHSKYGDCRMEQLAECAVIHGASDDVKHAIMDAVVTEDAVDILIENNILESTMNEMMDRIMQHLAKCVNGDMQIECMMYSNKHGMLAESDGAEDMLRLIRSTQLA